MDRDSLIVLGSIAVVFARMEANPSANAWEWILSQQTFQSFLLSPLSYQIEELGNRISCGASLLARSRHKGCIRLLEAPLARLDNFRTPVGDGNHKLTWVIVNISQFSYPSISYISTRA